MGLLPELIRTGLHFVCVAIHGVLIRLFFRTVGPWRRVGWVETVNHASHERRNRLIAGIGQQWQALTAIRLSRGGTFALNIVTLWVARLLLHGFAGLITW